MAENDNLFSKGYLSLGVRVYTSYPVAFVVGGALLALLTVISIGILAGPCLYGMAWMTRRAMRGDEISLADAFAGFEERFGTTFISGLAVLLLTAIGLPFIFVPFFIAALFIWMFPLLVDDEDARFADAFLGSIEFIETDIISRGLFAIVLVLIGFAGFVPGAGFPLFFLIGLFTSSWAVVTLSAAYYREQHPREKIYLPEPKDKAADEKADETSEQTGEDEDEES